MTRGKGKFAFCFVDSFDAVELTTADKRDYSLFRKKVVAAGRFSAFEASANQVVANLYTRLCRDPAVITDNSGGYPWTTVKWRDAPVDTRRMAETGTGSVRSTGSAVPEGEASQ